MRFFGFCLAVLFAGHILCLEAQDLNGVGNRGPESGAQDQASMFDEIDSLFEEPPPDTGGADLNDKNVAGSLAGLVRQRGFTFDAAYEFHGGAAPGWSEAPWYRSEERTLSYKPGGRMRAVL